ncbi:hypothetical protein MHI27_17110 [Paenibacillus sp. FSL H8-0261]|uniref:hypothetical protein n=1 Tax=Paenibacillus sp. FSL H8-0261 TaxID=2921381 RepID=UPI003255CBF6
MNTYEVWVQWNEWDDPWCRRTVQGETAGKTKYSFWEYLQDGLWEEKFGTVVKKLRCRKIGGFKISDLFTNPATFREICERRAIDFTYQGMKIEVDGQCGVMVGGNNSGNIDVCFEGKYYAENCHPWWRTKYFDRKGNLIKEFLD